MYCVHFRKQLVTQLSEVQIALAPKAWLDSLHVSQPHAALLCLTLDRHKKLDTLRCNFTLALNTSEVIPGTRGRQLALQEREYCTVNLSVGVLELLKIWAGLAADKNHIQKCKFGIEVQFHFFVMPF